MSRSPVGSIALCAVLLSSAALADATKSPTIGDLKGKKVDVQADAPVDAGAQRAKLNYQEFLNLEKGDAALRAEAMRRLGDLKLEAGELDRIEKDLAQGSPLDTTDAIALYTKLLAAYPNYERNDAVMYQLARAYEADQQIPRALETLDALVKRYPTSRYIDEAQFRRGEELFSARRWADADGAYGAVVKIGPRSEFYEQSLYKQGWAQFKRGESDSALDSFTKLLDRKLLDDSGGERSIEGFTRPQRELVEDTLRVCAITFSFDDDAKGVDTFLARHGRKAYAHLLYSTLGDLYVSKERWTDAANAYRAFVKREPGHDAAPLLEMQAIEAYKRGGFAALVLDGKREYVQQYRLGSAFWATRKPADAPLVVRELKINVKDLAAYYHEQAQASKQPADYQEAARWYREFLQSFPDDAEAAATNYLLADTLFESHQYQDAAEEYEHAAYGYPPSPKSATAGYAALVSYDKREQELSGDAKAAWHRQALESGLRFATTFQDHAESAPVLVRTAREFFDLKDYAKAIDVADIVLARRPAVDAEKQRTAWTVIANGQFELGQFEKAEGAYLQVEALMAGADPQRQAIEERIAASIYKQGEAKQSAGDSSGAVDDYLRIAKLAPGAKVRASADYDAAALLIGLKDWSRAIDVLEAFRRNFPNSELQPEVTRRLAAAYVEANRPAAAAAEFERIANANGGTADLQREALLQAAQLYDKAGATPKAVSSLEAYVKRYPSPYAEALEARQKLADYARQGGDGARRRGLLEEIVRVDHAAGAARTDRSRYLAAKASLELAEPTRAEFNAIRLTLPLKKSLEAKRSAMQRALKAYQAADEYAVADVSTAATFEMAQLYRQLSEDLLKSERPKTLQGEELEQYDLLLEEQAYPFEEKAIEIHAVNTARTAQGVYDDSVRASFAQLATLKPARFAKVEEHADLVIDVADGVPPPPPAAPPADAKRPSGGAAATPPAVPLASVVRFQEAVAAAEHNDLEHAASEFAALVTAVPTMAGPSLNLGIVRARQERWADAEAALNEALARHADSAGAAVELGLVLRQEGRFTDAEKVYARALTAAPDDVRAHRNFGILLDLYLQRPAEALSQFEAAQALRGGDDKQLASWIAEVRQRVGGGAKAPPTEAP